MAVVNRSEISRAAAVLRAARKTGKPIASVIAATGSLFQSSELPPMPEAPPRRARRRDPATSHAAAAGVDRFARGHYVRILEVISFAPATVSEIAVASGLTEWQINKRLPELQRAGRARVLMGDGVAIKRPGASGAAQRVWTV